MSARDAGNPAVAPGVSSFSQFEQNAGGRLWVQEGDATAACADARRSVHELIPGGAAPLEGAIEIGHAIADVVNAGAAPGQEFGDRALRIARFEQLDGDVAEGNTDDRGAVGGFGMPGLEAQHVAVEGERVGDARDGDADVGEARRGIHQRGNLTMGQEGANGMTAIQPQAVTDASFGQDVEQHQGLVVVDFWATWCGPCHMVAPIMEQLAGEYAGRLKVVKVDVDANQQTTMRFNVRSIPSILFFKDGRHVDTLVGAYPKGAFDEKIKQHLP